MFKIKRIGDRVEIYKDGELISTCEAYELDHICYVVGVEYEEEEI